MNQAANYITAEERKELQAELAELRGPKRKEILETLAYAKSLGDLSENAEYHQAREEQGKLESRIKKIEEILETSSTVRGGGGDVIEIGSEVVVQKVGTKEVKAILSQKKLPIFVGGTGLYIKSLLEPIDTKVPPNRKLRQ